VVAAPFKQEVHRLSLPENGPEQPWAPVINQYLII
jgi:hypothetical protein